ncbi:MAG: hypothetical protein ABW352_13515 [Polyangiales bacterium]
MRLLFAWLALVSVARADELSIADCAGASAQAIRKLVQLELASQELVAREVSLHCEGTQARITVQTQALTLSLDETQPEARARLLALTIAELVATHRLEEPARVEAPPPAPPVRRSSLWLGAGALRQGSLWLPTLVAGAAYDFGRLAGQGDLAFEARSVGSAQASTRVRVLSLSLAPMIPLPHRRFTFALGAGLRVGWAWLAAEARDDALVGRSLSGVYVAPIARGAAAYTWNARWATRLDLELGYAVKALRGLDADGVTLLKLEGLRTSATLSLSLAL